MKEFLYTDISKIPDRALQAQGKSDGHSNETANHQTNEPSMQEDKKTRVPLQNWSQVEKKKTATKIKKDFM